MQYGTKRVSSSPPIKPGVKRNIPTDTKSHELVLTENYQLLYEFSSILNRPVIQIESQLSFQRLKENYEYQWGGIVSLLRHFVSLLMRSGVTNAIINGHTLARLAFEFPLELNPTTNILLECVENKNEVIEEMETIG